MATRFCPFCDEAMLPSEPVPGVSVDVCSGCDSVWFDQRELRAYRRQYGVNHEKGRVTRRNAKWTGELLHCPNCDTHSLRRGWRGRTRIAHCVECAGFLLPNLVDARGSKLLDSTAEIGPDQLRRDLRLVLIGLILLIGLAWLLRAAA